MRTSRRSAGIGTLTLLFLLVSTPAPLRASEVVFWTTEVEASRMETQRRLADRFERSSGHRVKVVPVQESRMSQKVIAAKAADQLPDVIFVPSSHASGWAQSGILDAAAATRVIRDLGTKTFRGLRLVNQPEGYAAVPSDGWATLTLFRRDRYRDHDLPPPRSWEALLGAARVLHNPPRQYGILMPTSPNYVYTQQVLEQLALSNGVRLINDRGEVDLMNPRMVQTLKFYKKLARFTPPGNYYWKQTRLYYLVGRTSNVFWSPFILDELAGAREDIEVGVRNLPRKTAVFSRISGPHGEAGYLSSSNFGITPSADSGAEAFVKFMLSDGYVSFFSMDPFGKIPLREGTPSAPERFLDAWTSASPYLEQYAPSVIDRMLKGLKAGDRWGLAAGHGRLVSRMYGTHALSQILVDDFLRGSLSARETAGRMQTRVVELRQEIKRESPSSNR